MEMWSVVLCLCLCLVSGSSTEKSVNLSGNGTISNPLSRMQKTNNVVFCFGDASDIFQVQKLEEQTRQAQPYLLGLNKTVFLLIAVSASVVMASAIVITLCWLGRNLQNVDNFLFEGCKDLENLLNAPAMLLGNDTFGKTYKVDLEDGTSVTVKRLKVSLSQKDDFERHMEMVRRIKHENLVELQAFYYSNNEGFMIYSYFHESLSVAYLLHGENMVHLDWKARMMVALGAANGITRIHEENDGSLVHDNMVWDNNRGESLGSANDLANRLCCTRGDRFEEVYTNVRCLQLWCCTTRAAHGKASSPNHLNEQTLEFAKMGRDSFNKLLDLRFVGPNSSQKLRSGVKTSQPLKDNHNR